MDRGRVMTATVASLAVLVAPANSSTTGLEGSAKSRAEARVDTLASEFIRGLAFDPHDSNTIWAVLEGDSSLYRSNDGAQTWQQISVLPRGRAITLLGLDRSGQRLYVAADDGRLWQSSDGGSTWRPVANWPRLIVPIGTRESRRALVTAIAVHPANATTVYVATEHAILRTGDSGRTWRRVSRGLPKGKQHDRWYSDLAFNPRYPNVLYVVTHRRGLYRSENAGKRWFPTSRKCSRNCLTKAYPFYGDF